MISKIPNKQLVKPGLKITRSGKIYEVGTMDNAICPTSNEELLKPGQKNWRSRKICDLQLRTGNNTRQKMRIRKANKITKSGRDVWLDSLEV